MDGTASSPTEKSAAYDSALCKGISRGRDSLADDAVWSEPFSQGGISLLSGKNKGNSPFLRSIQALDQLKAREITVLFDRIP
jgi:hypothetical protein